MSPYKIDTKSLQPKEVMRGLFIGEKATPAGTVRLALFKDGFQDTEWCAAGHVGYVLEGRASVVFASGETVVFESGDIVSIPPDAKHKTSITGADCRIVFFSE